MPVTCTCKKGMILNPFLNFCWGVWTWSLFSTDQLSYLLIYDILNCLALNNSETDIILQYLAIIDHRGGKNVTSVTSANAGVTLRTKVFKTCSALIALRFHVFFWCKAQFHRLNLSFDSFDRNIDKRRISLANYPYTFSV